MNVFSIYYVRYKDYFQNSFLYFIPSVFAAIIGILINPFMAKNLSPEDYAVMGYFNSFSIIILPLMNFSLVTYYLRNYFKVCEVERQVINDTILIALLIFGLFIMIIVISVFFLLGLYTTSISFPIYPYAILAILPLYFNNFVTLYTVKCRLEREAGRYSKLMLFSSILSALLAISLVVVIKYGATGRMVATVIAAIIPGVYCFKQMFKSFQFDIKVIKNALRFGWPLSLSAVLWYFLSGVDIAMLGKLNNPNTLGYYNVGMQISGYFAIFYVAIAQTFEPDIYKAIAEDNKRKVMKIIGGIIILNAIPNLILIVLAPFVVGILTYNKYIDSTEFAQILALKNITITFYYSLITIIVGYGFTKSELLIRLIGAGLCYIMFKILISNYEFYGAAWGQVISFIILSILSLVFLLFKFRKNTKYVTN